MSAKAVQCTLETILSSIHVNSSLQHIQIVPGNIRITDVFVSMETELSK